jgi:predicted HTH transcriptional regulator
MNSKISGQDFLTRQLRSQINYYNKHGKLPEPEFKQKARADQFAHRKEQPAEQESTSGTTQSPMSQPSQAPATIASATPSAPPSQPKKTAHEMIQSSKHPDAANMIERKNRVDSIKRVIRRSGS